MKNDHFDVHDSLAKIIWIYIILVVITFISVYPLLDVVKISLRPYNSLFSTSLKLIPENATLGNFRIVLFDRPFMTWLNNSLIVSVATALLGALISITGAYSFSRFRFWGRRTTMTSFLLTQIFPAPMLLLPTYILLRQFGLANNFLGLIIPYVATAIPLNIWILKGYFDTIPISIEESAYVDGAGFSQILIKIVIPLSLPAIGVGILNSFMGAWNEYIIARIIMTDKNMNTLPVALVGMTGSFNSDWGIYSAASLITALPVMAVFIGMSKFLINGLTLGGVKG
ncbi:MAG TPA: ABC transporter permease subunit [Bacillota bacterium]|nr:ABC transporter permease subunit [Bacillota bacterium]